MLSTRVILQCVFSKNLKVGARTLSLSPCTSAGRRQRRHQTKSFTAEPNNVFALEEIDNLEAIEDFINQEGSQGHGRHLEQKTGELIQRYVQQQRRIIKRNIVERKYFKRPMEVNLLTWKAKEQIRYLNKEFPDEWTPERLAESFPVSRQGAIEILKSAYMPRSEKEIEMHDKRVAARWQQLKQTLAVEGGPVEDQKSSPSFQHIMESGKLPLMINAGGSTSLPAPRHAGKMRLQEQQTKVGVFASIVADSKLVKAQKTQSQKEKAVKNETEEKMDSQKLLQEIAHSGKTDRKVVTGYIKDHWKSQR